MSAVSEAKLAANRANAQLSTGPTSQAGKAKVSLNAVKTALTGRTVLLPTDDVAAYEAAAARFIERWNPQTEEERILVQSLADTDWRLQRIPTLEYGIYAMAERELANEFADEANEQVRRSLIQTKIFLTHRRELMNLQTQESRLRRYRQQDETRLGDLQFRRKSAEAERVRREAAERRAAAPAKAPVASDGGFEFSKHDCPSDDVSGEEQRRDEHAEEMQRRAELAFARNQRAA